MRKISLGKIEIGFILLFLFNFSTGYSQRIQHDILGDLTYSTEQYTAKLKQNKVEDLTFTDSNANKIEFTNAYLEKKLGTVYTDIEVKSMFFQDLILDYTHIHGYEASYNVDVLGELILTDNQGKKVVLEAYAANSQLEASTSEIAAGISNKPSGDWEYRSTKEQATLTTNLNGNRSYTDSNKTKIEIEKSTWEQLVKKHQTERAVFLSLVTTFLFLKN